MAQKHTPRFNLSSPDQVASYFVESATKKDLCKDFNIQSMLDMYETFYLQKDKNFPEAALVILSAAQIYCRKVEYLEQVVLEINKQNESTNNVEKLEVIRRKNRFRPQTISDIFSDLKFSEAPVNLLQPASVVTGIQKNKEDRMSKFRRLLNCCTEFRVETKQNKMEKLKYFEIESNLNTNISKLTLARKTDIIDYESDEICGSRFDYKVYLNLFDSRNGLLVADVHTSADSLNCSSESEDYHKGFMCKADSLNCSSETSEVCKESNWNSLHDLTLPIDEEEMKITKNNGRISPDEGVSFESIKSRSPSVCLFDTGSFIDKSTDTQLNNIKLLDFNILKLPENELRKQSNFTLPSEYKPSAKKVKGQEKGVKRCSTPDSIIGEPDFMGFEDDKMDSFLSSQNDTNVPNQRCYSPVQEDFLGFEDDVTFTNLASSTIIEHKATTSNTSTPNRTMSRDSGISDHSMSRESEEVTIEHTSDQMYGSPDNISASTSDLLEKVQNWHKQLKPILKESEKHQDFDIHDIGTRIIEAFSPGSSIITFENLLLSTKETSKYFLSMLQLANTNNVEIRVKNQSTRVCSRNQDIELRLLSRIRHHEEISNYHSQEHKQNNSRKRKRHLSYESIEPIDEVISVHMYESPLDCGKSIVSCSEESGYISIDPAY